MHGSKSEVTAPDVLRRLYDLLIDRYPCVTSLSDHDADDGVWKDGPLWNNFGPREAVLGIAFQRADEALPFVIETATSLGLAVFDWSTHLIHRAGGYGDLVLTLEDRPTLRAPTQNQIADGVTTLTPDGGPGFLCLEHRNGDYFQVAGGNGSFACEWRQCDGPKFKHWVAGRGTAVSADIQIATNGFHVFVKRHERLTPSDSISLLTAFAGGSGRHSSYT